MAARVIHFGMDYCYRLKVLRRAGYEIDACSNLIEFRTALKSDTDAVMVNDSAGNVPLQAFSPARFHTAAPIILFPDSERAYQTDEIDLVVPSFTPPEDWLLNLATFIEYSRALRATSRTLQEQSEWLRREAKALCE